MSIFLSYLHAASTISKTHYLELSLCWIFYLVLSAFSLISLINPFGILNSVISNFHCVKMFSWSLQAVSHLPSWRFEWGFQMNHTVHFRHLNVNHCIDKTFFGSLFSFFQRCSGSNMSSVLQKLNVRNVWLWEQGVKVKKSGKRGFPNWPMVELLNFCSQETPTLVLFHEYYKLFKNNFFIEHLWWLLLEDDKKETWKIEKCFSEPWLLFKNRNK